MAETIINQNKQFFLEKKVKVDKAEYIADLKRTNKVWENCIKSENEKREKYLKASDKQLGIYNKRIADNKKAIADLEADGLE